MKGQAAIHSVEVDMQQSKPRVCCVCDVRLWAGATNGGHWNKQRQEFACTNNGYYTSSSSFMPMNECSSSTHSNNVSFSAENLLAMPNSKARQIIKETDTNSQFAHNDLNLYDFSGMRNSFLKLSSFGFCFVLCGHPIPSAPRSSHLPVVNGSTNAVCSNSP